MPSASDESVSTVLDDFARSGWPVGISCVRTASISGASQFITSFDHRSQIREMTATTQQIRRRTATTATTIGVEPLSQIARFRSPRRLRQASFLTTLAAVTETSAATTAHPRSSPVSELIAIQTCASCSSRRHFASPSISRSEKSSQCHDQTWRSNGCVERLRILERLDVDRGVLVVPN